MQRYDRNFGFGFGQRSRAHPRGYDMGMRGGGYDAGLRRGGFAGGQGRGSQGQAFDRPGGDLRGAYGENYPTFGGIPGGRQQGMYYGGSEGTNRGGYTRDAGSASNRAGRGMSGDRGGWQREEYDRGYGGYDRGFAQQPFIPDAAYRQHPELNRPQIHRGGPRGGDAYAARGQGRDPLNDDEILQEVRQSLYADSWIDADELEVEVNDGVVTLRGEVDDYLEARYAWDDAWDAGGVRGVINQLTVRVDRPADAAQQTIQTSPDATKEEAGGTKAKAKT